MGFKWLGCNLGSSLNIYIFSFKRVKRVLQPFVFLALLFVTFFLSVSFLVYFAFANIFTATGESTNEKKKFLSRSENLMAATNIRESHRLSQRFHLTIHLIRLLYLRSQVTFILWAHFNG